MESYIQPARRGGVDQPGSTESRTEECYDSQEDQNRESYTRYQKTAGCWLINLSRVTDNTKIYFRR